MRRVILLILVVLPLFDVPCGVYASTQDSLYRPSMEQIYRSIGGDGDSLRAGGH